MPVILTVLGLLAAAAIWIIRAGRAADAAGDLIDAAKDVRLAARRFGFRRRANLHPVESVEEEEVAVAAIAVSFLELHGLPAREHQTALGRGLQRECAVSLTDAEELLVLGRWLMTQCTTPEAAVERLAKRLCRIGTEQSFTKLMGVIKEISAVDDTLSSRQKNALEDIQKAFRIS